MLAPKARIAATAAVLALAACAANYHPWPLFGHGEGMPNAVADDGSVAQSVSEGGRNLPFVMDGIVQQVTEHSVLIESDVLGTKQLRVTRHTEITVDGMVAKLAQIKVGMPIRAAYGLTGIAKGLQAGKDAWSDELSSR